MKALRVRKEGAQDAIERLKAEGKYDPSRRPLSEGEWVFVPVLPGVEGAVDRELPAKKRRPSLREKFGIGSFDLVGDVAIVQVPEGVPGKEVGEHLMALYPRLKAVYHRGPVGGDFRVPELELIAGTPGETAHRERGFIFKLDPAKVFFSPRQSSERERLLRYVRGGDKVAVFFAGVGPIPVYFSRLTGAERIYAVELNPDACGYMRENLRLNKCENVEVLCGDVRTLYKKLPKCDLVVMPLPHGAGDFLREAWETLKPGGRVIIYLASHEGELDLSGVERLFRVMEVRRELEIGPRLHRYVVYGEKRVDV